VGGRGMAFCAEFASCGIDQETANRLLLVEAR
jgi:hypothetical protein